MGDESEIAELRRRLAVLEQDAEGERAVSRHMFKKLNDIEGMLVDLTKAVAEISKGLSRFEGQVLVWQAEQPRKLSEIVAAVMREELARRQ